MKKTPKIHDFCTCSSIFAMPPLVSECLLDFGLISQNVSKITKKMVLVRPSPAEIVLNHLVGPSEVPGGSASNISIASTFVTARKGGPLRFSMADYSYPHSNRSKTV